MIVNYGWLGWTDRQTDMIMMTNRLMEGRNEFMKAIKNSYSCTQSCTYAHYKNTNTHTHTHTHTEDKREICV